MRRFLVLTDIELLLVEPGKHRLGCGVVHFIGFIQVGVSPRIASCYDDLYRMQTYQLIQQIVVQST